MSELAIAARAKAREKVERLTRAPKGDVDASGWREPLGEQANVQTGPRPVSRRQFRRGGTVSGGKFAHAGRKPRASGGMTATEYQNRDVKSANESREGPKHVGGMKKGGRAAKGRGGELGNEFDANRVMRQSAAPPSNPRYNQGAVQKEINKDPRIGNRESALIHRLLKGRAEGGRTHGDGCKCPKCGGGRVGKAAGGVTYGGSRPEGGRIARKHGGRSKKAMNVNIIIAPSGGAAKPAMPPPGMMPPPPPGAGPGLHQGMPPPMVPGGAPPGGPPAMGGPPPMMRKHGGRAYPIENGAGGGLGRLEKKAAYGEPTIGGASPKPRARGGRTDWIAKNSPLKPHEVEALKKENAEGMKKGHAPAPLIQDNQRPRPGISKFANGGRAYPIKDGAGGGKGRLEKVRAYG